MPAYKKGTEGYERQVAKLKKTIEAKYGPDYYKRIGQIGGRNGHTGGFAANPELARIAGAKGGRISRRGSAKNNDFQKQLVIKALKG